MTLYNLTWWEYSAMAICMAIVGVMLWELFKQGK